jgi:hypothetical protein
LVAESEYYFGRENEGLLTESSDPGSVSNCSVSCFPRHDASDIWAVQWVGDLNSVYLDGYSGSIAAQIAQEAMNSLNGREYETYMHVSARITSCGV